jgi:hypothetical protein
MLLIRLLSVDDEDPATRIKPFQREVEVPGQVTAPIVLKHTD